MFKTFFKKLKLTSLADYSQEQIKETLTKCPPELFGMQRRKPPFDRIRENDFLAKILLWNNPSLDVTWFALKILDYFENKKRLGELKQGVIDFLDSMFKENTGFCQTANEQEPSMHALHAALGIINIYYNSNGNVSWDTPIERDKIVRKFDKDLVEKMISFIVSCNKKGGFSDKVNSLPSINATASAVWCIWQLDAWEECCNVEQLGEFVENHMVETNEHISFMNSTRETEPYVCSTYYAFRILYSIQQYLGRKIPFHQSLIDKSIKVRAFVMDCKINGSGFAPTKGVGATLVHTKDALSLFKTKYELGFVESFNANEIINIQSDVLEYLDECAYTKGSILSGLAESSDYFPNVYGTLLHIDTKTILAGLVKSNEQILPKSVISQEHINECAEFLNSCINDKAQAFRGYSYSTKYIPNEWRVAA